MSLTKLSLAGNSLIITGQGKFVKGHPAGDGKTANLFYSVMYSNLVVVKSRGSRDGRATSTPQTL